MKFVAVHTRKFATAQHGKILYGNNFFRGLASEDLSQNTPPAYFLTAPFHAGTCHWRISVPDDECRN
jgi:hypothetical protein